MLFVIDGFSHVSERTITSQSVTCANGQIQSILFNRLRTLKWIKRNQLMSLRWAGFSSYAGSGPGLGWMLPERSSMRDIQAAVLCLRLAAAEVNEDDHTVAVLRCTATYRPSHSHNHGMNSAVILWDSGGISGYSIVTVRVEIIQGEISSPVAAGLSNAGAVSARLANRYSQAVCYDSLSWYINGLLFVA